MIESTLKFLLTIALGLLAARSAFAATHADGELKIEVVDAETHQPIAARMHLKNHRGQVVKPKLTGLNQFADHFYIDGRNTLPLMRGQYTFELEAGPEYKTQSGHFEIDRHADDSKTIEMHRFADLAKEGWWSGDVDVSRTLVALPLEMRAENLNVVPDTVWQNVDGKWSELEQGKGADDKSTSDTRSLRSLGRTRPAAGRRTVVVWSFEADGFECGDAGEAIVAQRAAGSEEAWRASDRADAVCLGLAGLACERTVGCDRVSESACAAQRRGRR